MCCLGVVEDFAQVVAGNVVLRLLADGDGFDERHAAVALDAEIGRQPLRNIFPDLQLVEVLEVGQAFEQENALHQPVGMLHLLDQLFVLVLAEPLEAPMLVHPRMQEVLIDGGELVGQHLVELNQNVLGALHLPLRQRSGAAALLSCVAQSRLRISGRHFPHWGRQSSRRNSGATDETPAAASQTCRSDKPLQLQRYITALRIIRSCI